MTDTCRICGNEAGNRRFAAREMMLGTRDEFEYVECVRCGSLQIAAIPPDLDRYYPADYYSLQGASPLERALKVRWMAASLDRGGLVGRLLLRLYGEHPVASWKRKGGLTVHSPILDVGCGDGRLLRTMRGAGFTDLTGTDPYLATEVEQPGFRLLRRPLTSLEGPFQLIMLHHALEHVPDPAETLAATAELLSRDGTVLVRTPVAGGHAWRTYGADWVQLDAPRHLHVITEEAMRELAGSAGLAVEEVVYDSSAFQFWGSELYSRDIPYRPKPSYRNRPSRTLISKDQMKRYGEKARELNARGEGDSAAFYLRPVRP